MDRENERELKLKEEADAFEEAALAEMLKAKGYGESPMVNSVLQSGRRVVYRAMQELARRVEVVRCKDCHWWRQINKRNGCGICSHETFSIDDCTVDPVTDPDDFCSYGERRHGE